ncbi:hypothetical protein F2P81_001332 [Scophthalmus maximus]|uniref:DNA-directed RNA polymerase I subunit RPA12 n=1 Tax=Scophthalmus maximus TaxID=52904 RepID=A0A6A4TS60_SCOMX|nr:hypothetical protein F2P81_001332 [Scophthalmus maximus]
MAKRYAPTQDISAQHNRLMYMLMSYFGGDPNFCPECGNILPVPGIQDTVRCPRCAFCIPITDFSGLEIHSTVIFNPVELSSVALEDKDFDLKGPVIDRRCSRCNKEGMVYHTRQMRSADEGQTVFFTCTNCSSDSCSVSYTARRRRSLLLLFCVSLKYGHHYPECNAS